MSCSCITFFVTICTAQLVLCARIFATPLDDYVHKPDSTYEFRDLGMPVRMDGYTVHYLNMTSQTWLSTDVVSCSKWWHILVVTIPDNLTFFDKAIIYVTSGDNRGSSSLPPLTSENVFVTSVLAFSTGTIAVSLLQVPNEPCVFSEDVVKPHKVRTEDAIIAFTWYHFLNHPDQPEYLLQLPMTKAVVRAMDTVTTFAHQQNSSVNLKNFIIAGASKRGWVTWTTAVVDDRVIAMIPMVADSLNLKKNLHHMFRAYGGWTFAFHDYVDMNITTSLDDPNLLTMAAIIDPYCYIDRMKIPKLIINAGGDEFFLPDDNYYFWDDLPTPKYLRMLPNAEHSMVNKVFGLILGIRAFAYAVMMDVAIPSMKWLMEANSEGGYIFLTVDSTPTSVTLYRANTLSATRRDFRLLTGPDPKHPTLQPVLWFGEKLLPVSDGVYIANLTAPTVGWTAFFIQVTFDGPMDSVHEFTTQVNIIPDMFPFPDCHGDGCQGKLV